MFVYSSFTTTKVRAGFGVRLWWEQLIIIIVFMLSACVSESEAEWLPCLIFLFFR